tara:strand:+ start:349 stop:591 length:243 start_codon:yes stop_codon:yes gene_type:complete
LVAGAKKKLGLGRKRKSDTKRTNTTLHLKLSGEDYERVEEIVEKFPALSRNDVVRAALKLALGKIKENPMLLLNPEDPDA